MSHFTAGEFPTSEVATGTLLFNPSKSNITWSQISRTANRHTRRALKRRKLAKKLVIQIINNTFFSDFNSLPRKQKEYLLGLLNNRGFTYYVDEEATEDLQSLDVSLFSTIYPEFIKTEKDVATQLKLLTSNISICRELQNSKTYQMKSLDVINLFTNEVTLGKSEIKKQIKVFKNFIDNCIKSQIDGHKHRLEYIKDIEESISISKKNLPKEIQNNVKIFSNIILHISNLQLRALRRYFTNSKTKKTQIVMIVIW